MGLVGGKPLPNARSHSLHDLYKGGTVLTGMILQVTPQQPTEHYRVSQPLSPIRGWKSTRTTTEEPQIERWVGKDPAFWQAVERLSGAETTKIKKRWFFGRTKKTRRCESRERQCLGDSRALKPETKPKKLYTSQKKEMNHEPWTMASLSQASCFFQASILRCCIN